VKCIDGGLDLRLASGSSSLAFGVDRLPSDGVADPALNGGERGNFGDPSLNPTVSSKEQGLLVGP